MCELKNPYIWLLQFIGLLGLIVLCLWLSLRPKSPSYAVVLLSIERPSNSNENGTIVCSLEIENPNKDSSIYYDDILLSFLYGQQDDEVGRTTISSFHQKGQNTREVYQIVNGKPRPFKPLINAISNSTAELKVALVTRFRYKTWGIKSKFHGLNLRGILPIDSDGKLSRKKKKYPLSGNSKKLTRSKIKP
ncbi:protein NDR1-like [Abrus precatorius]|uniref:Protein NDR1-like n=1 Tax=Abrus precatorius TaxID=3816 RepID=A0A8B8M3I2_ABRPR|nr:protein NDR1-like [Abrus precatorius]